jgi:hypothetical protein
MSRRSLSLAVVLALALTGTFGSAIAEAKKKSNIFERVLTVNAPILDAPETVPSTAVSSEFKVPKKFKGKVVGDVNVLGIQTTGAEPDAANDLEAFLRAPNGRTMRLFAFIGDQNLGPWTLDDDSPTSICDSPTPAGCSGDGNIPFFTLAQPFAGTSNTMFTRTAGTGPLTTFNGGRMRGTWTLSIVDTDALQSSTINQWGLRIKAAKPVTE